MIHGPCGTINPNCSCMNGEEGKKRCDKFFPKDFTAQTTIDSNGYQIYKRRDNGHTTTCRGVKIDNRYKSYLPQYWYILFTRKYTISLNYESCLF